MTDPVTGQSATRGVGASVPRLEAAEKACGRARYTDDITLPGMLHVALVLAATPHGIIRSIDTQAARGMPGVVDVVTGEDIGAGRHGGFVEDETILAVERVRYAGEPVAAVVAGSLEQARRAARSVGVEITPLSSVLTVDEAMAVGAPLVHPDFEAYPKKDRSGEGERNCVARQRIVEGDVGGAWDRCAVVVEETYAVQAQAHVYLEPVAGVADIDPAGRIVIWSALQSVHKVQSAVAKLLGVQLSRIRVMTPRIGGAFGGKSGVTVQPLAAALALRTGRPVKVVLPRDVDFRTMRSRHAGRVRMKTGATADGTLLARQAEIVLDGGAYAEDSAAVLGFAMLMARGPYRIANVELDGRVVYTNKLRGAGFRGFGNPQATFAGESQIDEVAAALNMDPLDLRLRNAVETGDRWIGGQPLASCGFRTCLERVRSHSGWQEKRGRTGSDPEVARGIGVASIAHICGLLGTSAIVRMLEDGSIALSTSAVDIGQGADTALVQICAEAFRVEPGRISHLSPDTDSTPYNWSTGGSRVTYMVGRAVVAAAEKVKRRILDHAAEMLECARDDLEIVHGGRVVVRGTDREVSFAAIAGRSHYAASGPIIGEASLVFDGPAFDPKTTVMQGFPFANIGTYVFGAQVVEVSVDRVTGQVRPVTVWAAHDVGRAVNPQSVEGQIEGGVVQGLGYALTEELVWEDGHLVNPSMADYKVPGSLDVPEIHALIVEDPEPTGPFGAKGIGEPGIIGVAPAVANAVFDAVGARVRRLPLTPARVLDAIDREAGAPAIADDA